MVANLHRVGMREVYDEMKNKHVLISMNSAYSAESSDKLIELDKEIDARLRAFPRNKIEN